MSAVPIGKLWDRRMVWGFTRVASLHAESLNEQFTAIREFASLETSQPVTMVTDLGSDSTNRRKMVDAAVSGDIIILTAIHRWSHNLVDFVTDADELLSRGVRLYLTSDPMCQGNGDAPAMARLRQALGAMRMVRHG